MKAQGQCRFCGVGLSRKWRVCARIECQRRQWYWRRFRKGALRECRGCGVEFWVWQPADGQVFCRPECRAAKYVTVPCDVCGEELRRLESDYQKFGKAACYDCQKTLAALSSHNSTQEVMWLQRSAKAKAKWYREQHRRRWLANTEVQGIKRALRRLENRIKTRAASRSWRYRIAYRLQDMKHRRPRRAPRQYSGTTIERELKRLESRCRWLTLNPWEKAITNKLSNMRARLNKKEVARGGQHQSSVPQDEAVRVQVCFDWMEDHA